jgi:aminomethyltransferase
MTEKGIPRHGYEITDADGNVIGVVTSGTQSPTLQKAIGMGYFKTEFSNEGGEVYIKIREKLIKASVIKVPFLKK